MFFFRFCATLWIWKNFSDFAAGFGLLAATDSDIRTSLMLINAMTQWINTVLGKAVNYTQIKQKKKGNQRGEKWQPVLGFPLSILPKHPVWLSQGENQPQEHLPGNPEGCTFNLEGASRKEWLHPQFIGKENGGRGAFSGRFVFSQGGGGIRAQISKPIIRKYNHKAITGSLKAWRSHCFDIPIAKGSPSKKDTKAESVFPSCLSFPIQCNAITSLCCLFRFPKCRLKKY